MTSVLTGSFYTASRGGHAPGDLREAFLEALDAFQQWEAGEPEPTVEVRDNPLPISQVFGLLWNCSDILPSLAWSTLMDVGADGEVTRRTYAAAARWLKAQIEE